ncbi:Glycosyltransferase involved in cell wall bisynthesis [Lachnospiraceae bacterium KH1T2]|nr:Glycosyltransferase involved in cell wall bisynthesis [Lachnospiraceae bacterium KH1T2]
MAELTVFTPTYNRAELLNRVYESLVDQTNHNFEWLIVDDGSTDSTRNIVNKFISEKKITVRYLYRENGGKMRSHNDGVKNAASPLFVCLDSDDCFTKSAVDDILNAWNSCKDDDKCAGIVAHKGISETEILYNEEFPDVDKTSLLDLRIRGFNGETTLVFRTDVLKENLFPEIEGEKYVPEDYVYDLIGQKYYLMVMPKILTICELEDEGYTAKVDELRWDNPTAWYLYYVNRAKFTPWSKLRLKYAAHCLRFALMAESDHKQKNPLPLLLVLAGIPGFLLLSLRRKL